MRRISTKFAVLMIGVSTLFCSQAKAACDPKDFTFEDVEKIDFSDLVKDMAYFSLDETHRKKSNLGIAASYGSYKGSYEEQHSEFERRLQSSGYSFDRDTRLAIVRTALSTTGAQMYQNCLGAETIKVDVPKQAFSDSVDHFTLTVRRKLTKRSPRKASITIKADNGLVNGQKRLTGSLSQDDAKDFEIRKVGKSTVLLTIIVDGEPYPTIALPASIPFPQFDYVERHGKAGIPRGDNGDGNSCTDQAYLVSEVGSGAGNGPKDCVLCVQASPGGVLLKSTAEVVGGLSARGAGKEVRLQPNNPVEACGHFWTSGAGQNSGRFEVYKGAYFKVFEAVPKK
jgi:hypothetical protein